MIEKIKSPNFQSEFISKIIHILGPELRLNIVSAYFTAPSKKSNFIKEAIIEKDKKVDNYRNKSEIQKIWLLLKINCTNQSGSYCSIEELLPEGKVNSSFDRVFIYDHFKGVVFPLEIIPYN